MPPLATTTANRAAFVWTRVLPAPGTGVGAVQRAEWLTPYTAATIAADALHAGRGARLEMTLRATSSDADVAALRATFAWLGARGVQVDVVRRGGV